MLQLREVGIALSAPPPAFEDRMLEEPICQMTKADNAAIGSATTTRFIACDSGAA